MPYYAVAVGKNVGIFENWNECKLSVSGFRGAIYKKFDSKSEADTFLQINQTPETIPNMITDEPDYYVYTDGACSNNGKASACAGIGIFFGKDDIRNVSRKVVGKQTNNTAELTAIIDTHSIIYPDLMAGKKIAIVSDSEYAIKCATSYGEKCSKTGWKKEIPNQELVKTLYNLYLGTSVQFIHVRAHTDKNDVHSIGNDYADKLANQAIGLETCPYH
jgi:ribonuclease HI